MNKSMIRAAVLIPTTAGAIAAVCALTMTYAGADPDGIPDGTWCVTVKSTVAATVHQCVPLVSSPTPVKHTVGATAGSDTVDVIVEVPI
jgi:hypothetical protein